MHPVEKVELLRACCCVAGADGTTTPAEREILERMAHDVGVGKASLRAMISRAETEPNFFEEQFRVLKADASESMLMLMQVAAADRSLTDDETGMMRKMSERLGVTSSVFDKLVERVSGQLDDDS